VPYIFDIAVETINVFPELLGTKYIVKGSEEEPTGAATLTPMMPSTALEV